MCLFLLFGLGAGLKMPLGFCDSPISFIFICRLVVFYVLN